MKDRRKTMKPLLVAVMALFCAGYAHANVIVYEQPFDAATETNMSSIGWSALAVRSFTTNTIDITTYYNQAGVNSSGYGFLASHLPNNFDSTGEFGINANGLFYTEDAAIQTDIASYRSVGFDYIGDPIDAAFRVAVKVGGQWYAQATATVDSRDNPGPNGGYLSAAFDSETFGSSGHWVTIQNAAVDAGEMALGSAPGSDLSGPVQATGLYLENSTDHLRFDNFIVTAALPGGYDAWVVFSGLTPGVNDGPLDDAEPGGGDGVNNLVEYALNGDPLASDAAEILPQSFLADGWFYYVHHERSDDSSLTYTVQSAGTLAGNPAWSTNGVDWVGESAVDADGFKSVTNRTDLGNSEFIRLRIGLD